MQPFPIVVLISGQGSNLQAIIDASTQYPINIRAVISNNADAYGLERARKAKIPCEVITQTQYPQREHYDQALARCFQQYQPKLIVLAGFMRILGPQLVNQYLGRIINIHPSLLPKYPGLHTHQRVLNAGDKIHGTTVHFVTPELDAGPIIAQEALAVSNNESEKQLKQRIQTLEHRLYPRIIIAIASGSITFQQFLEKI